MRVLVYHQGALGDFVCVLPCLRLIRGLLPGAAVTLLGRPHHGELALGHGLVDAVLDAGSSRFSTLFSPPLAEAAAGMLRGFDRALLFSDSSTLLEVCRDRIAAVDAHPPRPREPVSVYTYHARFVAQALAAGDRAVEAVVRALAAPLLPSAATLPRRLVWLHPGAGSPVKHWPAGHYGAVAQRLRDLGMEILWSFGPADAELRLTPALGRVPEDRVSVDATPRELARALADAALYVGADTGVTHLAAAVGCPTVALFGPTDERIWCPPGHHVRVLAEGDRWDGESASPCAPSPAGSECARPVGAISPADVLAAARDLLSRADVRTLAPPAGGR